MIYRAAIYKSMKRKQDNAIFYGFVSVGGAAMPLYIPTVRDGYPELSGDNRLDK